MSDDLLVKYLTGETTAEEIASVEQWLNASDANRIYFNQYSFIWKESKKLEPSLTVSENDAWDRFKEIREKRQKNETTVIKMPPRFPAWLRIAAVFVLIATIAGLYMYHEGNLWAGQLVSVQSGDRVLADTLPDGSVVTLNKHSVLSYPSKFSGTNRTVKLEGEAFFNVTPDKNKPFIIHITKVEIEVVGTSFNVKGSAEKTSVIVETGVVQVSIRKEQIRVNPKERVVVFENSSLSVKEKTTDVLYKYYRTKEFICDNTPLWKLIDAVNEAYNADIVIGDNRLKNLLLTTTFHDESLEEILKIIRETFNMKMERRDGQIILY